MRGAPATAVARLLSACATQQPQPQPGGAPIAALAVSLIGKPYQFGGADAAGFDYSGLARYLHERVGLSIPRTAAEQQRRAQPVPLEKILPGDLLFFRIAGRGVDHVGVYVGSNRFVHAPHVGSAVRSAT